MTADADASTAKRKKPKSQYSREVADAICERMSEGETLNQICRDEGMPYPSDVRKWVRDDVDDFSARYSIARSLLIDFWADETIDIADDASGDYVARDGEGSPKVVSQENIARSRLRVDSRKWILSKLRPETYGDKLKLDADVTTRTHEQRQADLNALEQAAVGNKAPNAD